MYVPRTFSIFRSLFESCYFSVFRPTLLKLHILDHLIEGLPRMYGLASCIEIYLSIPLVAHALRSLICMFVTYTLSSISNKGSHNQVWCQWLWFRRYTITERTTSCICFNKADRDRMQLCKNRKRVLSYRLQLWTVWTLHLCSQGHHHSNRR